MALAVFVLSGQWRDTEHGYLFKSGQDQTMWEWFFAETAHAVAHLDNPLGTRLQNFPDGVNMMANTAMFGVGVPLTPVTLLFGPTVTFVLVLTVGLAATAFAWYWLFSRELVRSRFAAAVGGLFCGFAPAMISHANAHPNFVLLAALPVIAGLLIRMGRRVTEGAPTRRVRDATVLGVLVALQIALGEEPLLIFALAFGVFAVVYYLHRPRTGLAVARGLAPTVGLAALITLGLTEIPLYWQFFGPQSYRSIDHGPMGNDLKALVQFPSESLGGLFAPGQYVAINPTEENAYFGWPLLVLVAVTTVLLWRNNGGARSPHRIVRAAASVIVVFGVLSLGQMATLGKQPLGVSLPWKWLDRVPLLNTVLETRFSMAAIPAIAIILALATERALGYWNLSLTDWRPLAWFAALVLALAPLTPTVLPVIHRESTPGFFTDGTVNRYVRDGSVVIAPPPMRLDARALRWQVDANFEFPLAGGYFVGPTAGKKGRYGPDDRPTAALLMAARDTGQVPAIDDAVRDQALADLRYWQADVVVLPPTIHGDVLHTILDQLFGFPGQYVEGMWVWDVRELR
ncbi:glycosyl transferase [Nocardia transvalensis]|uniref:glycosyl transferase n=1 Tax=Nocardia transvalensis TaxID=37333 RepID=UPI001E5F275C|nr:glycosyl transferase [Nocardia transvalensis]